MKTKIAALIAGVILGTTSTAVAAQSYYWHEKGHGYKCEGVEAGMQCFSAGFQIGVTDTFVYIKKGKGAYGPTLACRKYHSWASCIRN